MSAKLANHVSEGYTTSNATPNCTQERDHIFATNVADALRVVMLWPDTIKVQEVAQVAALALVETTIAEWAMTVWMAWNTPITAIMVTTWMMKTTTRVE
jgi:hypothetical protein